MLQILVAILTATALVMRLASDPIDWWFWTLIGGALIIVSCVMNRITQGIIANSKVLSRVGHIVGDTDLPDISKKRNSASHWLTVLIFVLGCLLLVLSAKLYLGGA